MLGICCFAAVCLAVHVVSCLCCVVVNSLYVLFFFFFKQKTAYEMRISDWSSDVCSSDLRRSRSLSAECLGLEGGFFFFGHPLDRGATKPNGQIGRASCRERVCQYV